MANQEKTRFKCDGCGDEFSKGHIATHRGKCPEYRTWAWNLQWQCPCGLGFGTERSLRSHKKGCAQAVNLTPGGRICMCGQRVLTTQLMAHREVCPGPTNPETIVLTHSEPPNDETCVCGKLHGGSRHRDYCPQWWVYRQGLTVKCEGCGLGFRDVFGKRVHAQACDRWQTWREQQDLVEKTTPCPSCGELMRGPQLGLHVNTCTGSFTKADWESWRNRKWAEQREADFGHFPESDEGKSFVTCKLCDQRFHQLAEHLTVAHGVTAGQYRKVTGGATFSSDIDARRKGTLMERYGVDHPSKIPDHWEKTVATFVRKYGVSHPLQLEQFLMARKVTCLLEYGVEHPHQSEEVQAKIRASNQRLYGTDYYFTSDSFKAWSTKKYGTPNPMGNKDYVLALFEKISPSRPGPNKFEQRVWDLCPSLIFTGNWVFWRYLPLIEGYKNPDFLVPGPDPEHPRRGITKVVEAFGDYHHGERKTGRTTTENEQELIEAYADIGITCLVLWEREVKKDPDGVRERLTQFCGA